MIKIALRRLLQTPGFTSSVVATLAICLGANLTIFAVVNAILVRPLPFPDSDRLVLVSNSYPGAGAENSQASIPNYFDRRHAIKAFSSVSLYQDGSSILGRNGSASTVPIARVTPEFFDTLGVRLAMGRCFRDENLSYSDDQVAVITDSFWKSHFGGDPNVIGRTFVNDRLTARVIGVLPPGFRYLSSSAQYYKPASHDPSDRLPKARHSNNYQMIARLAPGATIADAQAQINAFNVEQAKTDPYAALVKSVGFHTIVASLHGDFVKGARSMLILVQTGALFLLLLGAVNIANLLLVRASGRSKEFAVRRALGAGSLDTIRDVMAETLILSLTGGLCGLALARTGIDLLRALGMEQLPLGATVGLDGGAALVGLGAALLIGVALTLPIVWFHLRGDPARGLQADARGGTAGRAAQRLRHTLVVVQVALAFTLLSGAGLLGMSLKRVLAVKPGFQADGVLTGSIGLPWLDYRDDSKRQAFARNLLDEVRPLPGVSFAALTTALPFTGNINDSAVTAEGQSQGSGGPVRAHYIYNVTPDYWRVMGIPLLRGRLLEESDLQPKAAKTCVVDEAFAERYWPGANPLGKHLASDVKLTADNAVAVVGVVRNVKQDDLAGSDDHGTVYFPMQGGSFGYWIAVRTSVPPAAAAAMIRKAVFHLDPGLPVDDLKLMTARVDDTLVVRRSPAILTAAFAGVALLLAAIGTYGVLSYAVAQRQREIGVRMALGAQAEQIRDQFLQMGARLFAFGAAVGIFGAWGAGLSMSALLFGVPPLHAPTIIADSLVLGAITISACLLPAWRAATIDPVVALRAE